MQDRKLNTLISHPRSLGITTVFGFRHLYGIPPNMRCNLDVICIGTNPLEIKRQRIYESFFQDLFSYEVFCDLMDQHTRNNGFLVLRQDQEEKLYRTSFI